MRWLFFLQFTAYLLSGVCLWVTLSTLWWIFFRRISYIRQIIMCMYKMLLSSIIFNQPDLFWFLTEYFKMHILTLYDNSSYLNNKNKSLMSCIHYKGIVWNSQIFNPNTSSFCSKYRYWISIAAWILLYYQIRKENHKIKGGWLNLFIALLERDLL